MRRTFAIIAVAVLVGSGSAQPVDAQAVSCLTPGELRNDFSFGTEVLNNSLVRKAYTLGPIHWPAEPIANPGLFGRSQVEFAGPTIRLDAFATREVGWPWGDRQIEAFARGKLFTDFAVDCGSSENASVDVAVSFRVRRVGRMTTFWPWSTSSFGVSARIRDLAENRDIDFRVIEDTTVGNLFGKTTTIAKVPIPIPEIESMSEARVETFVIQVRKGRVYRFELFAAARSTSGFAASSVSVVFARANFQDPVDLLGRLEDAGIELADFTLDVEVDDGDASVQAELAELRRMVESLREAVASLGAQLEAVGPAMDARFSDVIDGLAEQDERHRHALDAATQDFENHTHDYRTGKGEGHNNTVVTTSRPKKSP